MPDEEPKLGGWKRLAIVALGLGVVVYAVDFLSLRVSVPRRPPIGSVTVHTYYAVKLKSGKTEYDDAGDQIVSCSNSLLPQMGVSPCWYVRRHLMQQITIDSGNPNNPHIF